MRYVDSIRGKNTITAKRLGRVAITTILNPVNSPDNTQGVRELYMGEVANVMSDLPIDEMVRDACELERRTTYPPNSLLRDVCCHVKALATEVARLQEEQKSQLRAYLKHKQTLESEIERLEILLLERAMDKKPEKYAHVPDSLWQEYVNACDIASSAQSRATFAQRAVNEVVARILATQRDSD